MSYLMKSAESVKRGYSLAEYYDTVAYLLFFIIAFKLMRQAETASYCLCFQMSCADFFSFSVTCTII